MSYSPLRHRVVTPALAPLSNRNASIGEGNPVVHQGVMHPSDNLIGPLLEAILQSLLEVHIVKSETIDVVHLLTAQ